MGGSGLTASNSQWQNSMTGRRRMTSSSDRTGTRGCAVGDRPDSGVAGDRRSADLLVDAAALTKQNRGRRAGP